MRRDVHDSTHGNVKERTAKEATNDLRRKVCRAVEEIENSFGMGRCQSDVAVSVHEAAFGARLIVKRIMYDEEERVDETSEVAICAEEIGTAETLAKARDMIREKIERAVKPATRRASWRAQGCRHAPLWSYNMHPLHLMLLGKRLPAPHMLHPVSTGSHRTTMTGINQQHGARGDMVRGATVMHVRGVIGVEAAALTVGGVDIEIGGANSAPWLRLMKPLPDIVRTTLVGRRIGDLLSTGNARADDVLIESIVPGVRGDRIILEDVLVPVEDPPAGVERPWLERRHADVAERFRTARKPD